MRMTLKRTICVPYFEYLFYTEDDEPIGAHR